MGPFGDITWHAKPNLPNLAAFSACVSPALKKDPSKYFIFDEILLSHGPKK